MLSSNKKLDYEKTLFSRFLYDSRSMLISYGIKLPSTVFKGLSFYSIDLPLSALWLSTLTYKELETFYNIKNMYILKLLDREIIQDEKDNNFILDINILLEERKDREIEYFNTMKADMIVRKQQRFDHFINNMTLNYTEKDVVTTCKDVWMNDNYCDVELGDMDLYERFREAVLNDIDSSVVYGRQVMAEIEVY
jgi:hypothetical protein